MLPARAVSASLPETGLSREAIYKAFKPGGNPTIGTVAGTERGGLTRKPITARFSAPRWIGDPASPAIAELADYAFGSIRPASGARWHRNSKACRVPVFKADGATRQI